MFSFFKKRENEPVAEPSIDGEVLDAHLTSIKVCLLEILNYKKKRFAPTPTHIYWRSVDIEETWASTKEAFAEAFRILCIVSTELHVSHHLTLPETSFSEALKTFIALVEQIDEHIRNTQETQRHTNQQLHHIDNEILQVQSIANGINRLVTKEFQYSV